MLIAFIVMPKNSGLKWYAEMITSNLKNQKIIEVRGEDVPLWLENLQKLNKNAIGFTGEDLYKEYCLNKKSNLRILSKIKWNDPGTLFKKPTLCLIGSKDIREL